MRKRNYKKEYRDYHGKPSQIRRRAARNAANRAVDPPPGKEVDHKDGNPRNNARSNLRVVTAKSGRKQGGRKRWGKKGG